LMVGFIRYERCSAAPPSSAVAADRLLLLWTRCRCYCTISKLACSYVGGPMLWTRGCEKAGCGCMDEAGKGRFSRYMLLCSCCYDETIATDYPRWQARPAHNLQPFLTTTGRIPTIWTTAQRCSGMMTAGPSTGTPRATGEAMISTTNTTMNCNIPLES